jgi:hypothetical protein
VPFIKFINVSIKIITSSCSVGYWCGKWSDRSIKSEREWHKLGQYIYFTSIRNLNFELTYCTSSTVLDRVFQASNFFELLVNLIYRLHYSLSVGRVNCVIGFHYLNVALITQDLRACAPIIQGGSNMTGTNCDLFTHRSSWSYLNHLV